MKIATADAEFQLVLADTNFANYWHDWIFAESNDVELIVNEGNLSAQHGRWMDNRTNLFSLLDDVNSIAVNMGLGDDYIYTCCSTTEGLVAIHEKWAGITKQACELHLPIYSQEVHDIYTEMDRRLKEKGQTYPYINNCVHAIEFNYKFFYEHGVRIDRPAIPRGQYVVQPSDTSFVREILAVPYYDIGRPQFEKYMVSGKVAHPEISNYLTIANVVEFTANRMGEFVPQDFLDECDRKNVPVWGNYLNIASSGTRNWTKLGEFFLTTYGNNEIYRFVK